MKLPGCTPDMPRLDAGKQHVSDVVLDFDSASDRPPNYKSN
jgi:hypothetical protein